MSALRVTLVDYGAGNLPSVERALCKLGAEPQRVAQPAGLAEGSAIILPGVGHFGALMRTLRERRLLAPLRETITNGVPFLGICLGLQALFAASDEDPQQVGLGIFPGRVQPLPVTAKVPHIGWNQVRCVRPSILLRGMAAGAYFYFAHSYAALEAGGAAVAMCDHGVPFVAALERENVLAVQFHPEKSGEAGAQVLRNFLAFAESRARAAESAR